MKSYLIGLSAFALTACGGGNSTSNSNTASNGCPPAVKNENSLLVSGRYEGGIDAMIEWNQWRDELPPRSCAGSLGNLMPSLPEGFGVFPELKPPIMSEDHIYISYARMPDDLSPDPVTTQPRPPVDNEIINIELVIWSNDEMTNFERYLSNAREGSDYLKYNLNGQPVYSIAEYGAFPTTDKMSRGLMMRFPGNLVAKVMHKDIYSTQGDVLAQPSVFKDILLELQS
ncbi:MAG: hypothetical protein AAFQ15_06315 [Pseudomonadota bacterium]